MLLNARYQTFGGKKWGKNPPYHVHALIGYIYKPTSGEENCLSFYFWHTRLRQFAQVKQTTTCEIKNFKKVKMSSEIINIWTFHYDAMTSCSPSEKAPTFFFHLIKEDISHKQMKNLNWMWKSRSREKKHKRVNQTPRGFFFRQQDCCK